MNGNENSAGERKDQPAGGNRIKNLNVELNVNISTNCNPAGLLHQTAQFAPGKAKLNTKSISIVKEENESKENSKQEAAVNPREESKKNSSVSSSSSSSSEEQKSDKYLRKSLRVIEDGDAFKSSLWFKQSKVKLEDIYNFKEILGEGGYGKVIKVEMKESKQIRAWKIQSKVDLKKSVIEMIRNEMEILKITDHPNIVKVYEFTEDSENFNIIMEFLEGGELFEYICK